MILRRKKGLISNLMALVLAFSLIFSQGLVCFAFTGESVADTMDITVDNHSTTEERESLELTVSEQFKAEATKATDISVSEAEASAGEEVTLSLDITEGYGFGAGQFELHYDGDKLEYVGTEVGEALKAHEEKVGDITHNAGKHTITMGYVTTVDFTGTGSIMEARFKVKEGAEGTAVVSVAVPELKSNDGQDIQAITTDGQVTIKEAAAKTTNISVSEAEASAGEEVALSLDIIEGYGFGAGQFELHYDGDKLEYVGTEVGEALKAHEEKVGDITHNAGKHTITMGYVTTVDFTGTGSIMEARFKVKEGAEGTAVVSVAVPELKSNDGQDIQAIITDGQVMITKKNTFPVVISDLMVGGNVTADKEKATAGETVQLTVTPTEGKQLVAGSLKVTGTSGTNVALAENNSFVMPNEAVTITAQFEDAPLVTHAVTVSDSMVGGSVTTDKQEAAAGETVQLTVTPAEGKQLVTGSLKVTGNSGTVIALTRDNRFIMPAEAVTVTAAFEDRKATQVWLDSATVTAGDTCTVGVNIEEGSGFAAGTFVVQYDSEMLEYVQAKKGAALMGHEGMGEFNHDEDIHTITYGYITLDAFMGKGSVLDITFKVNENATGTTPISLQVTELKDDQHHFITANTTDGQIAVTKDNTYAVTVNSSMSNGTVKVDKIRAAAGETVQLTVIPAKGKQLVAGSLQVTGASGTNVALTENNSFAMPAEDVIITAEFENVAEIKYNITIDADITGGTIKADKTMAASGETVTLTVQPDSGKRLVSGSLKVNDGNIEVKSNTFTMPAEDVTITARFEKKSGGGSGGGGGSSSSKKIEEKVEEDKNPDENSLQEEEKQTDLPETLDNNLSEYLDKQNYYPYISGYPDKTIRPDANITRAEMATLFANLLQQKDSNSSASNETVNYTDVSPGDWYYDSLKLLQKYNLLQGYPDGTFRPNQYVTRAEFVTVVSKFTTLTSSSKTMFTDIQGHWAENNILIVAEMGWINGYADGTFRPDQNITRAETVTVINKMLGRVKGPLDGTIPSWVDLDASHWAYEEFMKAAK